MTWPCVLGAFVSRDTSDMGSFEHPQKYKISGPSRDIRVRDYRTEQRQINWRTAVGNGGFINCPVRACKCRIVDYNCLHDQFVVHIASTATAEMYSRCRMYWCMHVSISLCCSALCFWKYIVGFVKCCATYIPQIAWNSFSVGARSALTASEQQHASVQFSCVLMSVYTDQNVNVRR